MKKNAAVAQLVERHVANVNVEGPNPFSRSLVETFDVDPYQGFVALMAGCSREGYRVVKIERKGNKAKVTYERIE